VAGPEPAERGRQWRRAARRGRLLRRRLRVPLTVISTDLLLAEVTGSAGTLAGIAATADLTTTVPTCPDWTLRQLITHVGRAHRWAAAIVATQAAEPIPFREVPDGRLPDDPAERPAWLRDGAARLAETVTAGSGPVWTPLGPGPASYWARLDAVYYGNDCEAAARAGFDDSFLYQQFKLDRQDRAMPSQQLLPDDAWESFQAWQDSPNKIEY